MNVIERYQQSADITREDEYEIIDIIEENLEFCPVYLYRGVCLGKQFQVGDIITTGVRGFESWSEDEWVAVEFSKDLGPDVSAVFQIENEYGLPLENYSDEMEWLILAKEYEVVAVEEKEGVNGDGYMLYTLKIANAE